MALQKRRGVPREKFLKMLDKRRKGKWTEPRENELFQSLKATRAFKEREVIGHNIKIPLTTGIVSALKKAGESIDKVYSVHRKKEGKGRRTIEIDFWGFKNNKHYLFEFKNLPPAEKENLNAIRRYYKQAVEVARLVKNHPYILGTADTRTPPIKAVGNPFYRLKAEKWMEGGQLGYFLIVNRPLTEKEWKTVERIREKTGVNVPIIMDTEVYKLIEHIESGNESETFAGKEQRIVMHRYKPEGPIDRFMRKQKKGPIDNWIE